MPDKNLGKRCAYADNCPIYNGKTETKKMPLYIYRNVFCNRGIKGWNNCEQYRKYELNALSKSNKP
jgi:hypothetical protein